MGITRILAARWIPQLRGVAPADFASLLATAKERSREQFRRSMGWIFVLSLVLPFLVLGVLPILALAYAGVALAWSVLLVPVIVLAAMATSEIATAWVVREELGREARMKLGTRPASASPP
jgi:hypothetical protein